MEASGSQLLVRMKQLLLYWDVSSMRVGPGLCLSPPTPRAWFTAQAQPVLVRRMNWEQQNSLVDPWWKVVHFFFFFKLLQYGPLEKQERDLCLKGKKNVITWICALAERRDLGLPICFSKRFTPRITYDGKTYGHPDRWASPSGSIAGEGERGIWAHVPCHCAQCSLQPSIGIHLLTGEVVGNKN